MTDWTFDAIGTRWSVETAAPLAEATRRRVEGVVEDYDRTWSRFRADSVVTSIAGGGTAAVGPEAAPLLGLLLDLERRTGGAVTPLIGGSLEHLGYDAEYRMRASPGFAVAPPVGTLRLEPGRIALDAPATIDVGAAGKGQLVDLVGATLAADGHDDFVVDGGRDVLTRGRRLSVGLEHPFDATLAIGVVDVADGAICASATNLRAWDAGDGRGRLHHVLDGRTGRPVERIAATWVLAGDAMTADALATALFFVDPESLLDAYVFSFVRMRTDGRATWSRDLPGEVFV